MLQCWLRNVAIWNLWRNHRSRLQFYGLCWVSVFRANLDRQTAIWLDSCHRLHDADATGCISFQEFERLHEFLTSMQQSFSYFDQDKGGSLSLDEVCRAVTHAGVWVRLVTASELLGVFWNLCAMHVCALMARMDLSSVPVVTTFSGWWH